MIRGTPGGRHRAGGSAFGRPAAAASRASLYRAAYSGVNGGLFFFFLFFFFFHSSIFFFFYFFSLFFNLFKFHHINWNGGLGEADGAGMAANFSINYTLDRFSANATVRYIGPTVQTSP